jgi:flagellar hook protein FlgE
MLGALFTALGGMNAFTQGLQTISNNVANLDTTGYKAQTVSFEDVFNQGGNGLDFTEGADQSVGAGVTFGTPQIDFSAGTMQQTGGKLDLAIQGNGFLVLKNEQGDTFYGTTGQFAVDANGYIASSTTGDRLTILNGSGQAAPINVNADQTNPPVGTSTITFTGNISSALTQAATVQGITVYDSSGAAHTWTVTLTPPGNSGTPGQWTVSATDGTNNFGGAAADTIQFTASGAPVPGQDTVTFATTTYPGGGSVTLSLKGATSFAQGSSNGLQASNDGNPSGNLTGITVNSSGQLVAAYSNNQTTTLGTVAIADFQNPQQLRQASNGLFINNSLGAFVLQSSGQGGVGTLLSGQVEASNVNLTAEFGDLILIQRGFDASSQIVSATNDMIQSLFGIRGHG